MTVQLPPLFMTLMLALCSLPGPLGAAPLSKANVQNPSSPAAPDLVRQAIERGVPAFNEGRVTQCVDLYEKAARDLLALPPAGLALPDRDALQALLAATDPNPTNRAWALRRALDQVLDNETFQPLIEAPMPEGFPKPGPIGRVLDRSYPVYRAASADGGRGAFWSLFNHIKKNDVPMTAPVEMTMDTDMRIDTMAFLYERPAQGQAGADGKVQVKDLPPVRVLTVALRGYDNPDVLKQARAWIEAHAAAHQLKPAGSWRVLGYNSPMVPANRRVWELQLPVTGPS